MNMQKIIFIKLRLVMSFIFLWAFVDKVWGLGFATPKAGAWVNGGSPTYGFLTHAKGPFAHFFVSLAGQPYIDWLFMAGLLFIGLTLLLKRYMFWGSVAGVVMVVLMWLAVLPPANNPIVDEHIIYAIVFSLLAVKAKRGESV